MLRNYAFLLLFWAVGLQVPQTQAKPFPKKVKRILFLGNSITYSGKYVTDIATYLTIHYPKRQVEIINVGLPSETVSGLSEENHANGRFPRPDLHERLTRILAQTKPDLVFASYGMNDGIYLPFNEQRFKRFREGMAWLHGEVEKTGAKIIHLTPPVYDEAKGGSQGYGAVLDRYSDWLLSQRKAAKWEVIDVHFPMKSYLEERRKTEPDFAYAKDGVHPDELGHWIMAKQILLQLGEKKVKDAENVLFALPNEPKSKEILKLVTEQQTLMKDAWLTAIRHLRPEMKKGLPLDEAKKKAAEIDLQIQKLLK